MREKEASGGKSKRPSVFGSDTKGAKDSAGKTEEITEQNLSSGEDDDSEEDETSSNGGTEDLESGPCEFEISAEEVMGIKVVSEMVDRVLEIRCKFYMGQSQDQEQRRSRPQCKDW
ncbi:hypothetical protein U1Q18_040756 [Sarracenia purpurea var. burkii]